MQPLQKNAQAKEEPASLLKQLQGAKSAEDKQAALSKFVKAASSSEKTAKYFAENYGKIAPTVKLVLETPIDEKNDYFLEGYITKISIVEGMLAIGQKTGSKNIPAGLMKILSVEGETNERLAQTILNGVYRLMGKEEGADYIARNYAVFREAMLSAPQLLFDLGAKTDSIEAVQDLGRLPIGKEQMDSYWGHAVKGFETETLGPNMRKQMLDIFAEMYGKTEADSGMQQALRKNLGAYVEQEDAPPEKFSEYPALALVFLDRMIGSIRESASFKPNKFQKEVLNEMERNLDYSSTDQTSGEALIKLSCLVDSKQLADRITAQIFGRKGEAKKFLETLAGGADDFGPNVRKAVFDAVSELYLNREKNGLDEKSTLRAGYCLKNIMWDPAYANMAVYGKNTELAILFAEGIKNYLRRQDYPALRKSYEKIVNGIFERAMDGDKYAYELATKFHEAGVCHTEPEKHYDKLLELVKKDKGHLYANMVITAIMKNLYKHEIGELLEMFDKFNEEYENGNWQELKNLSKVNGLVLNVFDLIEWPILAGETPAIKKLNTWDYAKLGFYFTTHDDILSRLVRANIWSMIKEKKPDVPAMLEFVKEEPRARDYFLMSIGSALEYSTGKEHPPMWLDEMNGPLKRVKNLQKEIEKTKGDPKKEKERKAAEASLEKGMATARKYVGESEFATVKEILKTRLKSPYTGKGAQYLLDLVEQYEELLLEDKAQKQK